MKSVSLVLLFPFFLYPHLLSAPVPSPSSLLTCSPRCVRLGLQPLAFLWRRDQETLLSDMISADLHALLIKVAALGGFVALFFGTLSLFPPVGAAGEQSCPLSSV